MKELPEKFPEYSIMYKTLTNQIKALKQKKVEMEVEEIKLKIQRYESEKTRIEKMFPDNFFEEFN
jgi:predicted patatin/cPLA2 family phospholipase